MPATCDTKKGMVVPQNYPEAVRWYQLSLCKGIRVDNTNFARCLSEGKWSFCRACYRPGLASLRKSTLRCQTGSTVRGS